MAQEFQVTDGSVVLPGGKGVMTRGHRFQAGSPEYLALGGKEVDRLVRQGYLRHRGQIIGVDGPGTTRPQHAAMPTTVTHKDANLADTPAVEFGDGKKGAAPELPRGGDAVGLDEGLETSKEDIDREKAALLETGKPSAKPGAPDAPPPGTPRGIWLLNPADIAELDIDSLNVLVQQVDDSFAEFEEGEEDEARALLSSDWRPQEPEKGTPSASGDTDASDDTQAIRI